MTGFQVAEVAVVAAAFTVATVVVLAAVLMVLARRLGEWFE